LTLPLLAREQQSLVRVVAPEPLGVASPHNRGRVFVVIGSGLLTAFDPATGSIAWSKQLPGQWSFTSAPTGANGIVYTGGAGSGGTVRSAADRIETVGQVSSVWTRRAEAWLERHCAEQSVPVKLSDPVALAEIAENPLLGSRQRELGGK